MPKMQQHNPMVDMVRYQLEASMQLADAVFSGTEKIDRAVIDATHQTVDGQLKFARAVADIRDPSKIAELQTTLTHRPEQTMQCQQQIMSAFAEMQAEFGKSIQYYMERFSQVTVARTGEVERTSEAGSEQVNHALFNPVASVFSMWENAFREVSTLANRNMVAARSSIETAAHTASEAVAHAVDATEEAQDELEHGEKKHGASRRK
jgi:hypothetical protein